MSNNPPGGLQQQAQDSSTSRMAGQVPDSLWSGTRPTAQAERSTTPQPEPRLPNIDMSPRSYSLAVAQSLVDREFTGPATPIPPEMSYRQPNRRVEPYHRLPVSSEDVRRSQIDTNRIIFIPPDPPRVRIDPADETDAQREIRELREESTRRIEEMIRTTELARAMMPVEQHVPSPPRSESAENPGEHANRSEYNSTLRYLDRQQQFRARYAIVEQLRNGTVPESLTRYATNGTPSSEVPPTTSTELSNDPGTIIERSNTARRDLDRAIRQYRIARRELRAYNPDGPSTPGEQNDRSYQGVLAQLAEQSNNRNRTRTRGQSQASALEQTDALVDSIANAAGIDDDNAAWRLELDGETVNGPVLQPATRVRAPEVRVAAGPRSALPAGVSATSRSATGPNTVTSFSASATRTLTEFQNRMNEYQLHTQNSGRLPGEATSIQPAATNIGTETRSGATRTNMSLHARSTRQTQAPAANKPSTAAKSRAKKTIQYLTELRKSHDNPDRSLALTKAMGLESLAASLINGTELDLPLRVEQLPQPQYSSFLEPGMAWEGIQRGGFGKADVENISSATGFGTGPLFERGATLEDRVTALRALRHRERLRAERQTRLGSLDTSGVLRGLADSADTLADVERHLSDLLEEEERGLGHDDSWRTTSGNGPAQANTTSTPADEDDLETKWPVHVTLHEVNWEKMTVSGTMVASQAPEVPQALETAIGDLDDSTTRDKESTETLSSSAMETFFDGEIIDFVNHEMETVCDKVGYNIGGVVTDLKYWSRLGPFKQEVKEKVKMAKDQRIAQAYEKYGITGTLDEQRAEFKRTFKEEHGTIEDMDVEEIRAVAYDTMAECLGSQKWMEKAMGEGGWIFMRWKERCFVEPSTKTSPTSPLVSAPANPTHARTRTLINRGNSFAAIANRNRNPTTFTTSYNDDAHHSHNAWGLTIRGFYYVALNRMSGRIEALYYDSGSPPFQELRCVPLGMANAEDVLCGETPIGIRKDFGVIEFR